MAAPSEGAHLLLAATGPVLLLARFHTLLSLQPQESTGVIISRTPFLSPQVR